MTAMNGNTMMKLFEIQEENGLILVQNFSFLNN
jgi:hypothetical protein